MAAMPCDAPRWERRYFLKRRVYQQVDGRYRPVARHEALAEITQEIVVACLRPRRDESRGLPANARLDRGSDIRGRIGGRARSRKTQISRYSSFMIEIAQARLAPKRPANLRSSG